jgi:hypothetical protein
MRKSRWLNLFILIACLFGQLFGDQATERRVSSDLDCCITEVTDPLVLTECPSAESPQVRPLSKSSVVLASSRFSFRRSASHPALLSIPTQDDSFPAELLGLLTYRSTDNRGPPLV